MDAEETQRPSRFGDEHEGGQKKRKWRRQMGSLHIRRLLEFADKLAKQMLKVAGGMPD